MVKVYEVDKAGFIHKFLELLNVIQSDNNKIPKMQREILAEFLLLHDEKYTYSRFHSPGRKMVIRAMKEKYNRILSETSMTQFLTSMIERGVITKDEDGTKYLSKPIKNYLDKALKSEEPIEIKFKFSIKDGDPR